MSRVKIGYFWYDTKDRVLKCPKCGKWMYDMLVLGRQMDLTETEKTEMVLGMWGVAFCPTCYQVILYGKVPKRFQS